MTQSNAVSESSNFPTFPFENHFSIYSDKPSKLGYPDRHNITLFLALFYPPIKKEGQVPPF